MHSLPAPLRTVTLPLTLPPGSESSALETADYYIKQPTLYQWNLSVEHKLPGSVVLTATYIGTRESISVGQGSEPGVAHFHHQRSSLLEPGGSRRARGGRMSLGAVPTCRRDPNVGSNFQVVSQGESFYNALQIGVNKRLSHGFQIQANYVWSKALDDSNGIVADGSGAMTGQITDSLFTKRFDWGPSTFDVKHNLRANLLYRVPNVTSSKPIAQVAKGWWLGSVIAAQSGFPFSPLLSYASCLCGSALDRASPVTAGNLAQALAFNPAAVVYNPNTVITGNPNEWYNPNMFTLPAAAGTHGALGRNVLRGPGLGDWDLSVNKDTPLRKLGEAANLQFRAEFFNLLNRANFQIPQASVGATVASPQGISPTAGTITATTTTSRQIQLALKLIF